MKNLRLLVWAYLWLLIFEGALRKWILPQLDTPLLIVRDPLVIWIYIEAYRNRLSFDNVFLIPTLVLAGITPILSTIFGNGNFAVTFYGVHADFLQIPFIFLIPQIINRDDVILMGRYLLYMALPIAVLVAVQFRSPPDSLVNKGTLATHYGTVRPSGTFSYIAGLDSYFGLVTSFLFLGFIESRTYKIWLMAAVTFCIFLVSAVSGSRSCLVSVGIVVLVAILCVVIQGKGGMGLMVAAVLIGLLIPILTSLDIVKEGSSQLGQRIADSASNGEDAKGFTGRYLNSMLGPLALVGSTPIFGNGLGIGTNAAAGMLRGSRETFIGPEDEWGRLIFECGPIFGLLLVIFRIALTFVIAQAAFVALRRDNLLPMFIFAASGITILNGQWGVPTTLGFAIFGAGLTLAACVENEEEEPEAEDDDDDDHEQAEDESDHPTPVDRTA